MLNNTTTVYYVSIVSSFIIFAWTYLWKSEEEENSQESTNEVEESQEEAEMIEDEVIDQEPLPNDEHKDKAQSLRSRVIEHNLGAEVTSFIEKVCESTGTKITKLDELEPWVLDSLSTMVETKIQSKRLEAQGV